MVTIRKVTLDDVELVRTLRLRAVQDAPFAFSARLEDLETRPMEQWKRRVETWVAGRDETCFLAFGDTVNGMCGLAWKELPRAQLVALWVDPSARGSGVASVLVETVCQQALQQGASEIAAWVFEDNARAFRFYQHCGFKRLPVRRPVPGWTSAEVLTLRTV